MVMSFHEFGQSQLGVWKDTRGAKAENVILNEVRVLRIL